MSRKTDQRAITKLEAIYAQLPNVACRGLCSEACGPILMSTLEATRMRKADRDNREPAVGEDLTCVYLTPRQRCAVYAVRPLICRVWGVVKRMSCMHGCVPDRWLSDADFVAVAKAIERLGGPIVVSALRGLDRETGDTFLDLDTTGVPLELQEQLAERTRGLRALHGGRIVGLAPSGLPQGEWTDIDDLRSRRIGGHRGGHGRYSNAEKSE